MSALHFNAMDLNLLRVLSVLLEERSVTRASRRLGLTQSAVSHALARLRAALDDDLFVRVPDGLRPTTRAVEMAPRLRQAMVDLQVVLQPAAFVPAATDRHFALCCGDYVSAALLPRLVARMRAEAPQAELLVRPPETGMADGLDAGRIDAALGTFGRVPERFRAEALFRETMVWAVSGDNPLVASGALTLERLAALPHLILASIGDDTRAVDGIVAENGLERRVMRDDATALQAALATRGLQRRVALTIPHALAAPRIVGQSDMAALLPRRLAIAYAERYNLRLFDPPYASPPFAVQAVWRRDREEDQGHRWLLGLLREAAEDRERRRPRPVEVTPVTGPG
ncbi:MAG: LysR family transcriptional regulator [Geminicoccaceae bacterium]